VEAVIDDRNQVVDMWRRELGLTCLRWITEIFNRNYYARKVTRKDHGANWTCCLFFASLFALP
jgi:hypothetical protein